MLLTIAAFAAEPVNTSYISYPPGQEGDPVCQLFLVTDGEPNARGALISGCEAPFVRSIRKALETWRWEPGDTPHVEEWKISFYQRSPYAKHRLLAQLDESPDQLVEAVHATEAKVKTRVPHKYPPDGEGKSGLCKVEMWAEAATGEVVGVRVDGCEPVFHEVCETAAMQWEFEPVEGDARWIRTTFPFKFEEPPPEPALRDWSGQLAYAEEVDVIVPIRSKRFRPATCEVTLTVDADGKPGKPEAIEGCPDLFHVAAENKVRRSTFEHQGEPRPLRIVVPVEFPKKARAQR